MADELSSVADVEWVSPQAENIAKAVVETAAKIAVKSFSFMMPNLKKGLENEDLLGSKRNPIRYPLQKGLFYTGLQMIFLERIRKVL